METIAEPEDEEYSKKLLKTTRNITIHDKKASNDKVNRSNQQRAMTKLDRCQGTTRQELMPNSPLRNERRRAKL
jgi:hypothetical protein